MTSLITPIATAVAEPAHPQGRTIRNIVERSPELIDEAWCLKLFRVLLRSLEEQQEQQLAHRIIMPDTIVVRDDGEPHLLPSPDQDSAAANTDYRPATAVELRALAAVVHYAITTEMPPLAPLAGRGIAGYSAPLLDAVDRCMGSARARRPQSINELRALLGIEWPETAAPAAHAGEAAPGEADADAAPAPARRAPLARLQRALLFVAGAAVLGTAGLGLYALGRASAFDDMAAKAALQGQAQGQRQVQAQASAPAAAQPAAADPATADADADTAATPPDDGSAAAAAPAEPFADTTYQLLIKPWASVHVDGVMQGASPPLKRLKLAAGRHTIRLANPGFADHVVTVDAGKRSLGRIAYDFRPAPR